MKEKLLTLKLCVLLLVIVSQVFYIKHRIDYYREKAKNIVLVGTNTFVQISGKPTNGERIEITITNK